MVVESWSFTAKVCESCKTMSASVFCRADSAFLCMGCDSKIHAANRVASRHARVWLCEVCEQAPATVTCKADSAALCATCDHDIHTANPLAQRHERLPVVPFYDSAPKPHSGGGCNVAERGRVGEEDGHKCSNVESSEEEEEEAAAAAESWLLPNDITNEKGFDLEVSAEYLFNDHMDSYNLDMDILSVEQKPNILHQHYNSSDGVVPEQRSKEDNNHGTTTATTTTAHLPGPVVDGFPTYRMDYTTSSKPYMYNFSSQSISQSLSSRDSSLDVGVVPDHNDAMADVSNTYLPANETSIVPNPVSGLDREARVLRYKEKRKNRKFEKTIRYASRKAYAETRPRIKGRFAKRSEIGIDSLINIAGDHVSYGVVPSF